MIDKSGVLAYYFGTLIASLPDTFGIRFARSEELKQALLFSRIAPGSSNGRTPGFGPGNRGSNPCPGTNEKQPP